MCNISPKEWGAVCPVVKLPQLEHLERDGVNIQCVNSTDFVVGKQTNFNGPVTIISCADVWKQRFHQEKEVKEEKEEKEEELVIRDPVLSRSAAKQLQKLAEEKQNLKEDKKDSTRQRRFQVAKKLSKLSVNPPALVCLAVFLASAIALAVFFGAVWTGEEEPPKECLPLTNRTCLYSPKFLQTPELPKLFEAPAAYVVIYQTHDLYCYDVEDCKLVTQKYRNMKEKVECHFMVGGDGNVYEGCEGAFGENSLEELPADVLRICLIGNFVLDLPTYPQINATKVLIQFCVDTGYLSKNYLLAASNATSPDDSLMSVYKIIKKWPNFHENPFQIGRTLSPE